MLIVLWFAHYVPGFSQAQKGDFKYLVKFLIRNYVCLAEKIKEKKNKIIIIIIIISIITTTLHDDVGAS